MKRTSRLAVCALAVVALEAPVFGLTQFMQQYAATVQADGAVVGRALGAAAAAADGEFSQKATSTRRDSTCVPFHYNHAKICGTATYKNTRSGWTQTRLVLRTPRSPDGPRGTCWAFDNPQAHIYAYHVYGVRRHQHTSYHFQRDFTVNGCRYVDRHNYRVPKKCIWTTFYGKAHLDWARDREFIMYLGAGPNGACNKPGNRVGKVT